VHHATVRTQQERDRQTVRIAMVLPLVVLALVLVVAPLLMVAAGLGLLDGLRGVGTGVLPFLVVAYFAFVALRIVHRHD
jgi:hypothetical protein